jgi:RNA polymerase sigma factor (sigma-70 family)
MNQQAFHKTEAFIERLRAQDASAQQLFWKVVWEEVYQACVKILGQGLPANEMAVEVLDEFLSKYVHQISNPKALDAYLRMMAIRKCIKERKKLNSPQYFDMDEFCDDGAMTAEEAANYQILMPKLEECLKQLSPKAQRVLKLRYFSEMTNEKIGQRLGGSKQYIGRLITKCQFTLRKCLEG